MKLRDRQVLWKELENACEHAGTGGLRALPWDQLARVASLYRMASRDLAFARSERADPDLIAYLNGVVSQAHAQLYRIERDGGGGLGSFFISGFPGAFRRHLNTIALAGLFFTLVIVASYTAVQLHPRLAESLFDSDMIEFEHYRLERQAGEYKGNFTFSASKSPLVAAMIITNNVRVALLFFAAGALFCLPTLFGLLYNGVMVGVLTALTVSYGFGFDFVSLIFAHGVLELSALVISAAGGLVLGWTLISGGRLPRLYRLKLAAADATRLLGGAMAMLLVAGIIEGFVTPHFSASVRLTVGFMSGLAFATYVIACGWLSKRARERE